jgi:hypothetical protein
LLILSKYSEDEECHGNACVSEDWQTDLWWSDVTELLLVTILVWCLNTTRQDSLDDRWFSESGYVSSTCCVGMSSDGRTSVFSTTGGPDS